MSEEIRSNARPHPGPLPLGEGEPIAAPNELGRDGRNLRMGRAEVLGMLVLGLMAAYFLGLSWRRWPDPIVDSGPQLYAIWRVSEGARLYHDFIWNYGPLSVCLNAALFKCFGPGIMVLATANLVFYAVIVVLAYLAFRMAWGRLGAFAALAVFISVFSFSHLLGIGNYNFVTPYAAEATHGMLLVLVTAFVVVRWSRDDEAGSRFQVLGSGLGKREKLAFWLGLCGGLAAVMKPEFMLACGVLGMAGLVLRWRLREPVRWMEFLMIGTGLALPTLLFTAWFARVEPVKTAFIDASQAWWLVLVAHIQKGDVQQLSFSGFDHPWGNALAEARGAFWAVLGLGAIWAAGWFVNRPWSLLSRVVTAGAALVLASFIRLDGGWFFVGRCFPGLMAVVFILTMVRLTRELQGSAGGSMPATVDGRADKLEPPHVGSYKDGGAVMALMLVLLAGVMLARMPLFVKVFHLGFFQAALAGMVVAAVMVAELPRWTGSGPWGKWVTVFGCLLVLALGCGSIAARSRAIRIYQTEPVGWERDQFYSTTRLREGIGALVNWSAGHFRNVPPDATVLVLPEGVMINYLSRHRSPEPGWVRGGKEEDFVEQLRHAPPDYVVLISRDLGEFGISRYGAPGNPGFALLQWVSGNYKSEAWLGGDPLDPKGKVGAVIMRRQTGEIPDPGHPTSNIEVLPHGQ
ncbi:MAG: 4-amino-4-deoxy-L-arabinose transferase and related glycosyltransferase of family [Pedosphaera sp.]|nr:4-amino-4-deoxy-L-arabinose transferase and related glycosyltransferase of family [Pedosphaera sp.]